MDKAVARITTTEGVDQNERKPADARAPRASLKYKKPKENTSIDVPVINLYQFSERNFFIIKVLNV